MSFCRRSYRPWLWSLAVVALAGEAAAQPPSPLELVRGLREHGHVDLALEYLKDLEKGPLPPDEKAGLALERAKCILDAAEDEPDEGTRQGMVAEAKEGLTAFLDKHPNHPRAVEAFLAVAKLMSLDAKEQLNRARRMDIPLKGEPDREAMAIRQKGEAAKARPLFLLASRQFASASERLRARLEDKALDYALRRALEREAFEADLASGVNLFNIAETYTPDDVLTGPEKAERNKYLVQAKDAFNKLGKGPGTNRTVWVGRAWAAEVTYEQDDFNAAAAEVAAVLRAPLLEAEDGKRLARFFQLRRTYAAALAERTPAKLTAVVGDLRAWLAAYAANRKPTPEVYAVRYYLARSLQLLGEAAAPRPKEKGPNAPAAPPGEAARAQLGEAERLYRALSQSDHDFTARAARNRAAVVRRLLGDADQPPAAYDTFEKAQMGSLIHLGKMAQAEAAEAKLLADSKAPDKAKLDPVRAEIRAHQLKALALLERARELATPQDNPADVTDVLMRLIYLYQLTDQYPQSAVLGEYVAHAVKSAGGKSAQAGLWGLEGYLKAGARVKATDPEEARAARRADRERAVALARFLDEKYPNDNATDSARYRLAALLNDDKRYVEAFDAVVKVRPSSPHIIDVRLLEGYLAAQVVGAKAEDGKPAPAPEKKLEVFRRAVADLVRVPRPAAAAPEPEVKNYLSVRCRFASLMLAQRGADPKADEASPGYAQALAVAAEVLAAVPTFDHLVTTAGGAKKPNLTGLEVTLLARDLEARAIYLRARALMTAADKLAGDERKAKLAEVAAGLDPALADIAQNGSAVTAEMSGWGSGAEDAVAVQKNKIVKLAELVDKTRVEVLLAGFRLRVKQGKPADGAALLDLMVKIGGSVEENLLVLEAVGREMAARMFVLQKEGSAAEAEELGAGLAILLKKIKGVPKLTPQQHLFVGQMLVAVKDYAEAAEALAKVPEPEFKEWKTTTPEKVLARLAEVKKLSAAVEDPVVAKLPEADRLAATGADRARVVAEKVLPALEGKAKDDLLALQKEQKELEAKLVPNGIEQRFPSQIRDYALAQLMTARAYRELKKFDEAEKLLTGIIGTNDKPGWGSGRLYFRKELAAVYEDRGASIAEPKAANPEWGKAIREWNTVFALQRNRVSKLTPKTPADEVKQTRNAFADAFLDYQRCLVRANRQVLKAQPEKLQKAYDDAGKQCAVMEKQIAAGDWQPEVQNRYVDFLKEFPPVLAAYKANGGKAFLDKLPLNP